MPRHKPSPQPASRRPIHSLSRPAGPYLRVNRALMAQAVQLLGTEIDSKACILFDQLLINHLRLLRVRDDREAVDLLRGERRLVRGSRSPFLRTALAISPPLPRGRPPKRVSIDEETAAMIAQAVDSGSDSRKELLAAFGRTPSPENYKWLRRRVEVGRAFLDRRYADAEAAMVAEWVEGAPAESTGTPTFIDFVPKASQPARKPRRRGAKP